MTDPILEAAHDLLLPHGGKHSNPLFWQPERPSFFRSGGRWWRQDTQGNQTEATDIQPTPEKP